MTDIIAQASFNSGEWSPALFARVDLAKYKSGAAKLENWFVDYRGGASTRPGTEYIIQAYDSTSPVRLIGFQASFNVGYILEFGNGYIRFIYQGAPVVEDPFTITAATKAALCTLTIPGHNFLANDWIYISSVGGMVELNKRYFIVKSVAGNDVTIETLNGVDLDSTLYTTYTSGGSAARVYKISSPYTAADNLRQIKFSQIINQLIICHPNHPPYTLTLVQADNWTLVPVSIGATIATPAKPTITSTLPGGTWFYSYTITAIDNTGQESSASPVGAPATGLANLRTTPGTMNITWPAVVGAVAYNVYEANIANSATIPLGATYGFIGTTKSTTFQDSNISPDFSQTPPIAQNPFVGSGINVVNVTSAGVYTSVPTVTFSGSPTINPIAAAVLSVQGIPTISAGGAGYVIGEKILFGNGLIMLVTNVAAGAVTAWSVYDSGSISGGSTPTNPMPQTSSTGGGTGATATAVWGVSEVIILSAGAGFLSVPTVIFSFGAATATAVLGAVSNGNPTVPGFVQQRLVLGGANGSPATFYMSQPGRYFNFDISNPVQGSDAVSGTLVSSTLNSIKSIIGVSAGMLVLTDKAIWLVNGGGNGTGISPTTIVANPQSFIGSNDVPPIITNHDVLFVESKGASVRDITYNIYYNTFTSTDISVMASHLFYNFNVTEWAWAQSPYYLAHCIRNDGVMLVLTFVKEQEFVGWTHYVTDGNFKSVAAVTEPAVTGAIIDAVYTQVDRVIDGQTVKYIERFTDRVFTDGVVDAWSVDSGLQYSGAPSTSFGGAEHLSGRTVTGVADGIIIPTFTMPSNGRFTLPVAAEKVTVGLAYTCDLQTLPIDTGDPTIQGRVKKISAVDIRVRDTLGLKIGTEFSNLVEMKDLVVGNVSGMLTGKSSQIVTDLVTGDAIQVLDATYTVYGQYCIRQDKPYPASVLGLFPRLTIEGRHER